MKKYDFAIIGAGAAGIAAAGQIARTFSNATCVLIEKDSRPGGILLQCIHTGFGLNYFKQELTGPEYAQKAFAMLDTNKTEMLLNTTVIEISHEKTIQCCNEHGSFSIAFDKLVLATGSREIPFSALSVPSNRPAGIFGAGEAQLLINRYAIRPGNTAVILGAGDIGLIMARRLVFEGMQVAAVIEIRSEPGGVKRNIQTCIYDLEIPLHTESTIIKVHGQDRVTGVTLARVNSACEPDFKTTEFIACDFVLSAIGLMPEISLAKNVGAQITNGHLQLDQHGRSSLPWLYACGNAARIFPIVDDVSSTAEEMVSTALHHDHGVCQ
ncbi:MAG: FAD-dependent oxidoreductase [Candidatus Riflebacteria bacterium]|nr:FAD-dependent oxidoreductase [Candidatus Riflebacteria bacterium]